MVEPSTGFCSVELVWLGSMSSSSSSWLRLREAYSFAVTSDEAARRMAEGEKRAGGGEEGLAMER